MYYSKVQAPLASLSDFGEKEFVQKIIILFLLALNEKMVDRKFVVFVQKRGFLNTMDGPTNTINNEIGSCS